MLEEGLKAWNLDSGSCAKFTASSARRSRKTIVLSSFDPSAFLWCGATVHWALQVIAGLQVAQRLRYTLEQVRDWEAVQFIQDMRPKIDPSDYWSLTLDHTVQYNFLKHTITAGMMAYLITSPCIVCKGDSFNRFKHGELCGYRLWLSAWLHCYSKQKP